MSKAIYYPKIEIKMTKTLFGATETDNDLLYETPIKGTSGANSIRVDALGCLQGMFGKEVLNKRDELYTLVSGSVPNEKLKESGLAANEYYKALFKKYYKLYPSFQNAVDLEYYFGDKEVPFISRFISGIRRRIDDRVNMICDTVLNYKTGKVLLVTRDYVYCSFRIKVKENMFEHMRVIKNV